MSIEIARQSYAAVGVNVDHALRTLATVPISIHCWQGDDVGGFESVGEAPGGGLAVTGNYPGKARTPAELRSDFEKAVSLIPGRHRINLHALYGEFGGKKVDRNAISFDQFRGWADWAKSLGIGVDFNPSYFAHPKAASGLTLTHPDAGIRQFWIEHGIATRDIAEAFGKHLNNACVNNVWIPDGYKDTPADRFAPRQRLEQSLDAVFAKAKDPKHMLDAIEGKLFGIGSESYVVGSHEFYLGYAIRKNKLICLDAGHYHPTESMADKISAVMCSVKEILLHVSRGVRWDSDHVVTLDDALRDIAREIVVNGFLSRTQIGLDYFDASINRVAAWVIGVRNMQKALLLALLEPTDTLRKLEDAGDYTARLALQEELKSLPFGIVWDEFCRQQNVPVGMAWMESVKHYERDVLSKRS
jgi:L-rhamnose isomerase